ncbi:putative prohibitin, Band 7 domain-containing protein [Medicago truncatula]|nr:prohibitin-3, mitochondrial [Medicago truncatula]RHN57802.1 putative prohibitin, Band 7 domain-containing protein [Medicago truncatula]
MVSSQAKASNLFKKARFVSGFGAAVTIGHSSFYIVKSGERAVLVDRFHGTLPRSVGKGIHFKIPWVQKPYIFDLRPRTHRLSAISATDDHEPVNLTLRVISRPEVQRLPTIVQNLGLEYDKILNFIANEVLESIVAKSSLLMLFRSHSWFSERVKDAFVGRAKDLNILIDEIDITHFSNPR